VSVIRGGRELARLRHNLEAAGLDTAEWGEPWDAERLFITADGEANKYLGSETIRWHPEQHWLEIKLTARLGFLANSPRGRYRLNSPVSFRHRGSEVGGQAIAGPIRYDISYQPHRRRWYLDASWWLQPGPVPELSRALSGGVLGVDLNAGHLEQSKASTTVTRHHAAAVIISRRSLGQRARRRPDVTDAHRRLGGRELSVMPQRGLRLPRTLAGSGGGCAPHAGARRRLGEGSAAGAQVTEDRSR
jgi:hypothetical protein